MPLLDDLQTYVSTYDKGMERQLAKPEAAEVVAELDASAGFPGGRWERAHLNVHLFESWAAGGKLATIG